jgi:hypothetical protein
MLQNRQTITVSELESHTRAMLRRIAKEYDIPMKDLLTTIFTETKAKTKAVQLELEFVQHSGKDYLYDPITRNLYDVHSPHPRIGQLTEDHEILVSLTIYTPTSQ